MELWSLFQEQILGMRWLNEWLGRGLSVRRQCTVFPV